MNHTEKLLTVGAVIVVIDFLIGGNIVANFLFGMLSAVIVLWTRRRFNVDLPHVIEALLFGVIFAPFFLYLLWYAAIGARSVPPSVASDWLLSYVNAFYLPSIPSTMAGGFGAIVADELVKST